MKNFDWFIFGCLTGIIILLFMDKCEKRMPYKPGTKPEKRDSIIRNIDTIKHKNDILKAESGKWKVAKDKVKYRTEFNPTENKDSVLRNLKNCDTIVKIDSILLKKKDAIIAGQDTMLMGKDEIISDLDIENQYLDKEVKKQKRKLIFTKILAGVVIVLTILIAH